MDFKPKLYTRTVLWVLASLACLTLSLFLSYFSLLRYGDRPAADPVAARDILITVQRGSSFNTVRNQLVETGIIDRPLSFRLLARLEGLENSIQAGEYEFSSSRSPLEILTLLSSGQTRQYRLTLVEGWTFEEALSHIQSSERVVSELQGLSTQEISTILGTGYDNPEGLLFPDTYFYTSGTTDLQLLVRAHSKLQEELSLLWQHRVGALPYAEPYEALIMASIIEKESASSSERDQIAGVFVRRLELGMRLQSDPTVIYGMGESFTGNISRADLRETTAYNTYRINGMPPTPIALSGRESIEASLNPRAGDSLYFVSRGDGSHVFSATLDEHNAAVNIYQRGGGGDDTN